MRISANKDVLQLYILFILSVIVIYKLPIIVGAPIMVLCSQTKMDRNFRCISLQQDKEVTIEKEKNIR